jgi:hypothetical protein
MKVNPVGPNQTVLEGKDGTTLFYSYQTLVAAFVPGRGALCSKTKYSRTTSKHVNAAVARWGATRHDVEQKELDELALKEDK